MNTDNSGNKCVEDDQFVDNDLKYLMLGEEGYLRRPVVDDTWHEESGVLNVDARCTLVAEREKALRHLDFIGNGSIAEESRILRLQALDKGNILGRGSQCKSFLDVLESPAVSQYWKCHALSGIMSNSYRLMPVPAEYSRDVAIFVKEHEYGFRGNEDVPRCHVLKLLADGNLAEMDDLLERSRSNRRINPDSSSRVWRAELFHLLMCQDFAKMGMKECARLCMTLKWIESFVPGIVANAKDRFGNNALIYLYGAYSEALPGGTGGDADNGFMFAEAIAGILEQYGCNAKEENIFGISAFSLVEERKGVEPRNSLGHGKNGMLLQLTGEAMPEVVLDMSNAKALEILEDVDFKTWQYWLEYHWNLASSLLKMHDDEIRRKLQERLLAAVKDSSPYYFTVAACQRDVEWIALASEEIPSVIKEEQALMERIKQNAYALGCIFQWCESGTLKYGLWLPEETCGLDFSDLVSNLAECAFEASELEVNRWTFLLTLYPEFAEACGSYQKFSGFDACMLLARQPQLSARFALDDIAERNGRLWVGYGAEAYNFAWNCLVKAVPEYAKFRKSVE